MSESVKPTAALPVEIQNYIHQASRGVRSRRQRLDIERELTSHALDVLDELRAEGWSDATATTEVVRRLGDVMNLNELLKEAHRTPLQRWLMGISASALTLVTAGMVLALAMRMNELDEREERFVAAARTRYPRIAQAQSELSKDAFFEYAPRQNDAGQVLNDLLTWYPDPGYGLGITDEFRGRLIRVYPKDDVADLKKLDVSSIELAWMPKLKTFDHWDFYSSGRGKRMLEESRKSHRFIPRYPHLISVHIAAQARLIKGLQTGEVRTALNEVEDVARLLISSENLLGFQMGIGLYYGDLPRFEKLAIDAGLLHDKPRYHRDSDQDHRSAGRALYALVSNLMTPPEYLKDVLDHPEWKVGRCAAINEMLYSMHASQPFLTPTSWPFERDFAQVTALRQQLIEQSRGHCRLTWYWSGGFETAEVSISNFRMDGERSPADYLMGVVSFLPYARRIVGLSVAGVLTEML